MTMSDHRSDRKSPWKTLRSRLVYQNPWIRVREDRVLQPDGSEGVFGIIEPRSAIGVVAITPENEVYLVGQYRYAVEEYSWEIVEGGIDPGEEPIEAARRELAEEVGLAAGEWTALGGVVHPSNAFSRERGYLFLARDLTSIERCPDENEILEIEKVGLDRCVEMAHDGRIRDALTIVAVLRALKLLGQEGPRVKSSVA